MVVLRLSRGCPVVVLLLGDDLGMSWASVVFPRFLSMFCFFCFFRGFSVVFLWLSRGCPVVVPWLSRYLGMVWPKFDIILA